MIPTAADPSAPAGSITGPAQALRRLSESQDAAAWTWLVDTLGPAIHRVALRLTGDPAGADDAVQECLLTLRDHAGSFRPRADPDQDALRWIMRVAANASLQVRRGRQRAGDRDRRGGSAAAASATPAPAVGVELERAETADLLRDELALLRGAEREAIVLHVVAGLTFDQVASELRCPVGTAKVRVHRGLERLRRRLGRRAHALSAAWLAASLDAAQPPAFVTSHLHALLASGAHAQAGCVPAAITGTSMTIKISLGIAAALIVATPLALLAQSSEAPVAAKPSAPAATVAAVPKPAPAAVLDLEQRLTFEFVDTGMADVALFLSRIGVPCAVDAASAGSADTVTLKVKAMCTRDAVRWLARLSGRSMKVANGTIMLFTTPADPASLLDQKLSLSFTSLSVADALDAVRLATGAEISDASHAAGDLRISFPNPEGMTAREALDQFAKQASTTWRVGPGGATFGAAPTAVPLAAAPAAIADKLQSRVTLDFQDSGFEDVMSFFQQVTGLNVVVDPKVLQSQPKSVTLAVKDQPFGETIQKVVDDAGLVIEYRDDALFITVPTEPAPKRTF